MKINQARITQILHDAGEILKARFFRTVSYHEKIRYDLVSEVDRELEDYLIRNLENETPGVSFFSEEGGEIKKDSAIRWIIDPLDGTANFIFGVPYFCISLGLEREGQITEGYIYNPMTDELYFSNEETGKSYLNGRQIKVSETSRLSDALVVFGFSANRKGIEKYHQDWNELFEGCRKGMGLLSPALNICNVARGRTDCFIDHGSNLEGHAAAALILKNAGGRVLNYDRSEWTHSSKGIFASNGSLGIERNTSGNQTNSLFLGMPTLETERLLLRKFELGDAADMFEYASDPEVTRYLTWDTHPGIESSIGFIKYTLARYQNDETGDWGIVFKEHRKFIGSCGFAWVDWNHSCGHIGYVLSRKYWGQGVMTEAVRCLIQFGFEKLGLNRIEAVHCLENEASGRVMQKAGMSYEGIQREKIFAKGRYHDVKMYAILKSDWINGAPK